MHELDAIDHELVSLLREDARTSVVALAKRLRLARGTVQNRIDRLERDGIIIGYSVRLRPIVSAHRIQAIMSILVEGHNGEEIFHRLRGLPNITALYRTNGRWDIIAKLEAESLEAFDGILKSVRTIPGIGQTETSILLSVYKA